MNEFETVKADVKESVRNLVDQGADTVDAIKARVSDVGSQVKTTSTAFIDNTRAYVEATPLKAVGLAFGLGYVAMRIRTSLVMELAFLGAVAYGVDRMLRRR